MNRQALIAKGCARHVSRYAAARKGAFIAVKAAQRAVEVEIGGVEEPHLTSI